MSDKILFVDDDAKILQMYGTLLGKKFVIETAHNAHTAIELINKNGPYSVIIADMFMPEISGIDLLEKIKNISPDTIRILITGQADTEIAIEAVNRGKIFHFLTKPCKKEELIRVIKQSLEKYKESISIKHKSKFDELCKVYNRHFFESKIQLFIKQSKRSTDQFSIIFIDINYLKEINDVYGHDKGDVALVTIVDTLKDIIRDCDMIARFGGDEFVIYLENTNKQGAVSLINRIKHNLKQIHLKDCPGMKLSIAAGASSYPDDGKSYSMLLKIADKNMYIDKKEEKKLISD